jgi:hypothetical protein
MLTSKSSINACWGASVTAVKGFVLLTSMKSGCLGDILVIVVLASEVFVIAR